MNILAWARSVKATTANRDIDELGRAIQSIVDNYLSGDTTANEARAAFLRAVDDGMANLIETAWTDGGRDLSDMATDFITGRLSGQRDFARDAWDRLQEQVKAAQAEGRDITELGQGFGDRWAGGAWGEYNRTIMETRKGSRKTLYTWVLGATEKHCSTCLMLAAGPAHTMDWYITRDYIPGGNGCALECGGWHCDCTLLEADGSDLTLTADIGDE